MKKKVIALIPVRLESTRLPGKALKDILGLPAIVHVYKRAELATKLDELYICTDSKEIGEVAEMYNCNVIYTGQHKNGSERISEAAVGLGANIIINIQGDEILVNPGHIDQIVDAMLENASIEYCLGVTSFNKRNSPQDFKAVLNLKSELMYCSRSDIPNQSQNISELQKLVFLVGFTVNSLAQFVNWPETFLEKIEPNEFLRIIEYGHKINTIKLSNAQISLDTLSDLDDIRCFMAIDPFLSTYRE